MAIVHVYDIGAVGIIKDVPPYELPVNAWSDAQNIRVTGYQAETFSGHRRAYNITITGGASITQDLAVTAIWLMPVNTGAEIFWIYAGLDKVYAANSNSNQINLTRQSATSTASITSTSPDKDYAASADHRWTGTVLQGVPILNNGNDPPQYWNPVSSTQRLQELVWDDSAGTKWSTRTAGAVTANVLRGYREFAVAMDTTEAGTRFLSRVRWSHPALPGGAPTTWEETRLDRLAGFSDLDDTGEFIVDGLSLRDSFFIYKNNTTWIMNFIGGNDVHAFRKQFLTVGALSRYCVREFFGKHMVLTPYDLVVHDGHTVESIIEKKWRNFLFSNISPEFNANCYLVVDHSNFEVWICYPQSGQTDRWPTMALIWNWRNDTWSVRDLQDFGHIEPGIVEVVEGAGEDTIDTWSTLLDTWAGTAITWGGGDFNPSSHGLLATRSTEKRLLVLNKGSTFGAPTTGNTNVGARLERTGLPIIGQGPNGPKIDITRLKHIRAVWPHISANAGSVIQVSVGKQDSFEDEVTWNGPFDFTVGEALRINTALTGRLLAVRFESSSSFAWALTGYSLDLDPAGLF